MPRSPVTRPRNPIVVIPARLGATRLPDKPLADIGGEPMIVHVWRRAVAAGVGPVIVACGDAPIAAAVEEAGGRAVLTDPDLPSGSDRVHRALAQADPEGRRDAVVNLQGDVPGLAPAHLAAALDGLADRGVAIATLAAPIRRAADREDPNVVKAVISLADGARRGRALYFTRAPAPAGSGPLYHHFGVYAFRREALETFVGLPPSGLENRERLEQLRALEAGMRIEVTLVDDLPVEVNTPADLERARAILAGAAAG